VIIDGNIFTNKLEAFKSKIESGKKGISFIRATKIIASKFV